MKISTCSLHAVGRTGICLKLPDCFLILVNSLWSTWNNFIFQFDLMCSLQLKSHLVQISLIQIFVHSLRQQGRRLRPMHARNTQTSLALISKHGSHNLLSQWGMNRCWCWNNWYLFEAARLLQSNILTGKYRDLVDSNIRIYFCNEVFQKVL